MCGVKHYVGMEILKSQYTCDFISNEKHLFFIVMSGLYHYTMIKSSIIFWFWSFSTHLTETTVILRVGLPCTKSCKNCNDLGSYFVSKSKFPLKKELIFSVSDLQTPSRLHCNEIQKTRQNRAESTFGICKYTFR